MAFILSQQRCLHSGYKVKVWILLFANSRLNCSYFKKKDMFYGINRTESPITKRLKKNNRPLKYRHFKENTDSSKCKKLWALKVICISLLKWYKQRYKSRKCV